MSQVAASNFPAGSDSPANLDDAQRAQASFIAQLRDGKGFSSPVTLASAATTDIGGQNSAFVEISGTTGITSFGTNYNGPRFLRFTGALLLTHNATTLNLPGAANITTVAGDTAIAYPNQALSGWNVVQYQRAAALPATAGANNDITSLSGVTTINGVPVGWAPKRQTILQSATAPLVIGTGLAVNLAATATPMRLSIPAGVGTYGAIDYPGNLTADVASFWSGLTANVVNYLFVDRNTSTGALTGVASILPYIAQDADTAVSVANGQHTYDYDSGIMYVGNGSAAAVVQRVAVGECLAGAATITTVTPYRKMRQYNSAEQTITAGTPVVLSHNLGVQPNQITQVIRNKTTEGGYPVGYEIPFPTSNPITGAASNSAISADRLVVRMIPGSAANSFLLSVATTGAAGTITNANWRQLAYVSTTW